MSRKQQKEYVSWCWGDGSGKVLPMQLWWQVWVPRIHIKHSIESIYNPSAAPTGRWQAGPADAPRGSEPAASYLVYQTMNVRDTVSQTRQKARSNSTICPLTSHANCGTNATHTHTHTHMCKHMHAQCMYACIRRHTHTHNLCAAAHMLWCMYGDWRTIWGKPVLSATMWVLGAELT